MEKSKRPVGRRKMDLSDESTAKVLKTSKTLARSDWGGKEADEQIEKKAKLEKLDLGPKTRGFIKKLVEEQIESCRKRMFPRIDEAIRRLEAMDDDTDVLRKIGHFNEKSP